MSDAETKLFAVFWIHFLVTASPQNKGSDLSANVVIWNLKLLYKDHLHVHLTGFSISIHDKKIALNVVLFY